MTHCGVILVPPVRVDAAGSTGPTRAQARSLAWRGTSQGRYVPSPVDADLPEQRIVEAAAVLNAQGAVTGWAALRWLGAAWCEGLEADGTTRRPVILADDDIRTPRNAVLSEEGLLPKLVQRVDGVAVTIPIRSVTYEMRYAASLRAAVRWFEIGAYADLVSKAEVETFLPSLNGWTGVPQLRKAMAYVDENSLSPKEVDLRLVWEIDAELPRPLTNRPIFDLEGHHVATPDLLDEDAGLMVEFEGGLHLASGQRRKDRDRRERAEQHGLSMIVVTSADLHGVRRLVERLVAARERGLAGRPAIRRWTLQPPHWWSPTHTVDLRRALSDSRRAVVLRHRQTA